MGTASATQKQMSFR